MKNVWALAVLGSLSIGGCQEESGDEFCFDVEPRLGTTFEITVDNFDPALYQIWLMWTDDLGRSQSWLLDILDTYQVGTWWIDVVPGRSYRLVLADLNGVWLDTADMGALTEPSTSPFLFTRLIVSGSFLP